MKKLLFAASMFLSFAAAAQENEIKPAAKDVVYGTAPSPEGQPVKAGELPAKMNGGKFEGKVTGKVTEVCKAMGCWIRIDKGDGTSYMVKTKDHAFFLPENIVGRTVVIEGSATTKEVSEAQRRHFAEDGGKSKEEIAKIKGALKEVQIIATGIRVVE
ncbi:MAG TPA: DUF4920 domain-containing protein [Chitinophagaceae bacterium]|nr:DUF4920 domain-containing protein [Chitinophagaceae bacterium]